MRIVVTGKRFNKAINRLHYVVGGTHPYSAAARPPAAHRRRERRGARARLSRSRSSPAGAAATSNTAATAPLSARRAGRSGTSHATASPLAGVRQDSFDKDGTETPERSDQQAVPALERDRRKGNGDHRQGVPLEASARRHGVSAAAELAAPFLALPSVSVGEAPDDQTMTAATLAIAGEGERPRLRPCGLGPLRRGRSGSAADTTGAAESDSSAALERFN